MFDEIYLETDEEVTSAIDKIKKSKKKNIALCLPRHAVLGQSIINLKLVYKEAAVLGKQVALVSPDKITRTLADKVGFTTAEQAGKAVFDHPEPQEKGAPAIASPSLPAVPVVLAKADEPSVPLARQRFDRKPEEAASSKKEEGVTDESNSEHEDNAFLAKHEPELPDLPNSDAAPIFAEPEELLSDNEEGLAIEERIDKAAPKKTGQGYGSQMIPTRGNLRFYRQAKRKPLFKFLAIGAGIILIGLVTLVLAVPSAVVKVTVSAQPFNETVNSNVDTSVTAVDVAKSTIPGQKIEAIVETKAAAKATGKKDVGEEATGTVTLFNEWDSQTHTFAAGTKVRAKNGNEFVTNAAVSLPGATSTLSGGRTVVTAGRVNVAVTAAVPGEAYNNAATTFTIPSLPKAQQEKIYGESTVAFTGGTTKVVTVVTQADLDTLTNNLKTKNRDDAIAKVREQAGEKIVLEKAIQQVTQDLETIATVDAEAESLEAVVIGKFAVIAFTSEDHSELLGQLLASKIPQGQSLVTQGEGVAIDTSQFDLNLVAETRLELTNNLKAFTITDFDKAAIRRSLVGSSPSAIKSAVEKRVPTKDVAVTLSPAQWPRLPFLVNKITVDYVYVGEEASTPQP